MLIVFKGYKLTPFKASLAYEPVIVFTTLLNWPINIEDLYVAIHPFGLIYVFPWERNRVKCMSLCLYCGIFAQSKYFGVRETADVSEWLWNNVHFLATAAKQTTERRPGRQILNKQ
jgi:hypothetical protein